MFDIKKIIINLENRPNRLINTINELSKVGLSDEIIRINACNNIFANKIKFNFINEEVYNNIKNPKNTFMISNFKALGCAISHLKCWKYIINNNINHAFIIEDDIEINDVSQFMFDYHNLLELVNSNKLNKSLFVSFNSKQINLSLCKTCIRYNNLSNLQNKNKFEIISKPLKGAHFYYLNYNMALLLYSEIKQFTYQIDIHIGNIAKKSLNSKFYNLNTKSIIQSKKFKSDIQFCSINPKQISISLKLSSDISNIIYDFIPNIYKIKFFNEEYIDRNTFNNIELTIQNLNYNDINNIPIQELYV